jgi:N6-adenosine-specific RNA methylase IME4
MEQHFEIIVMDPPWSFNDKLMHSKIKRGASSHYSTLTIDDIKNLPIKELADDNGCLLALWCPSSLLVNGIHLMEYYGFQLKQTFVWVKSKKDPFGNLFDTIKKLPIVQKEISKQTIKDTIEEVKIECNLQLNNFLQFNMGRLFRASHEIALIGINSTGIYKKLQNRSQRSVCFAPNEKHSKKPEDLQSSLEAMFPNTNKLEIFARRERKGWLCLGNECGDCKDIRVSLPELIKTLQ